MFEHAFHTYFLVGDLKDVHVEGLQDAPYSQTNGDKGSETTNEIFFVGDIDRVYTTRQPLTLHDPCLRRRIHIDTNGMASAIIWTPWVNGVEKIPDIPDNQWGQFVCAEVGNVWDDAITLQPGETHVVSMRLSVERN